MGSRVRNVMTELHGEKIDIVDYSEDPPQFVGNALSPARVLRVNVVDAQARVAQVIVPDYQLSLAIGKEGQNARLAARLTGWKIDIQPDSPSDPAGAASAAAARQRFADERAASQPPATGEPATREPATREPATGPPATEDPATGEPAAAKEPAAAGEPVSGASQETGPGPGASGPVRGGADAPAR
jgi:N utilization substance protein A